LLLPGQRHVAKLVPQDLTLGNELRPCTVKRDPDQRRRLWSIESRRRPAEKYSSARNLSRCPRLSFDGTESACAQEAIMGLLDQVLGGAGPSSSGRGMSPINMALLGLLAWLMQQTGMSREDLLSGLSREPPKVVDKLTPDGRIPTD
jgi:hypothetical protein